jgi:hypothetical protein
MAIKKTLNKKRATIDDLLELRDQIEKTLRNLCPPCPNCCPAGKPFWPCNPGEVIVDSGELGMCEECFNRGYLIPEEADDEEF